MKQVLCCKAVLNRLATTCMSTQSHPAPHSTLHVEAAEEAEAAVVNTSPFKWTWRKLSQSLCLFVLAAAAEVGGGWLVWQAIRTGKPWWWGLLGSVVLVTYGFVPTLQPVAHFARTFAVYGGFFIVYSYGWGWLLDDEKPDTGTPPIQCALAEIWPACYTPAYLIEAKAYSQFV